MISNTTRAGSLQKKEVSIPVCMKYLNAITTPYARIVQDDETGAILALQGPLDVLKCLLGGDGKARVKAFDVFTELTFLGTSKEENKPNNPVFRKTVFDVTLRLTRCNADTEKRVFVDLDHFVADLSQPDNDGGHKYACFDYAIRNRITRLKDQTVILPNKEDGTPAYGAYVLKVIIHEQGTPKDQVTVQGIASLKIVLSEDDDKPAGDSMSMPVPVIDCN